MSTGKIFNVKFPFKVTYFPAKSQRGIKCYHKIVLDLSLKVVKI